MSNSSGFLGLSAAQATAAQKESGGTFAVSLVLALVSGTVQLVLFILLKDKIPKLYQPKSFLVSARQRVKPIQPGVWQWIKPVFDNNDDEFLRKAGLDGFFICRYLIVLLKILGPATLLILPILIPLNVTGGSTQTGLNRLTVSNLAPRNYQRLWAHCFLSLSLVIWTCYVVYKELRHFIRVKQAYLAAPQHRIRASANTVLIRTIPRKYMDREELANLFDVFPGGLQNIWINRDYKALDKLIKQRKKVAKKLENAETVLIQKCMAANQKKLRKDEKHELTSKSLVGDGITVNNPGQVHHTVDEAVDAANRADAVAARLGTNNTVGRGLGTVTKGIRDIGQGIENLGRGLVGDNDNMLRRTFSKKAPRRSDDSEELDEVKPEAETSPSDYSDLAMREEQIHQESRRGEAPFKSEFDNDQNCDAKWREFIDPKDRDTMRLSLNWTWCPGSLNPRATKVDTIYHFRRELARLNKLIEEAQLPEVENAYPLMNSAFIQFHNQAAAHMACQSLTHQTPNAMTPRLVEVAPNDVIWKNLSISWWQALLRKTVLFFLSIGLVIAFVPLIAVSSAISQLDALRKTSTFAFARNWPGAVVAILQALLPIILVNLFIFLLGVLLRLLLKFNGSPTKMQVELSLQKYFFTFAFIQYFLIVTIGNVIPSVFGMIQKAFNSGSFQIQFIPLLLAQNIPNVSTYFVSNVLVQSFSQSMTGLFQTLALTMLIIKHLSNKTARSKFKTRTNLQNMTWGTTYPIYTILACIALIYSVIAPLILPLTFIGFGLWWISTRYQMLYIYRYTIDSGGLFFPIAIMQLFTGIYIMEIFLIGFLITAVTSDTGNVVQFNKGAVDPIFVVPGIAIVGTIIFQWVISRSINPLLHYLPITLEDEAVIRDEEFAKLLATRHAPEDETRMLKNAAQGGQIDSDDDTEAADKAKSKRRSPPLPIIANGNGKDVEDPSNPNNPYPEETLDPRRKNRNLSPGLEDSRAHRRSWNDRKQRSPRFGQSSGNQTPTLIPTTGNTGQSSTVANETTTNTDDNERTEAEILAAEALDAVSPLGEQPDAMDATYEPVERTATTATTDSSRGRKVNLQQAGDILQRVTHAPIAFVNPAQAKIEAQENALIAEAKKLYSSIPDDLEDLSPEERDSLVAQAYRHQALRAKRPCIWLPRDPLGISDAEVVNMGKFSDWIWASNEKQELDAKGKAVYTGPPPDFDQIDLIQL